MNKIAIILVLGILVLGTGYFLIQSDKDTQQSFQLAVPTAEQTPEVDVTNEEGLEDDEFAGTGFVVRGFANDLSVPEDMGKGYYYQSGGSSRVFYAVNVQFDGPNVAELEMVGGDLYELENVDASSFAELRSVTETNPWAKDKNQVYYRGVTVEDVDADTFDFVCAGQTDTCFYRDNIGNGFDPISGERLAG